MKLFLTCSRRSSVSEIGPVSIYRTISEQEFPETQRSEEHEKGAEGGSSTPPL